MYKVHIEAHNYDDDFILLVGGTPLREGISSYTYTGSSAIEALTGLLNNCKATDYNMQFSPDSDIPDRYRHVLFVRELLEEMRSDCRKGVIPESLHWGGNWDIDFVIKEI